MKVLLSLTLAAATAFPVPALAASQGSRIVRLRGRVYVERGTERLRAQDGQAVRGGDRVVTKGRAWAVIRLAGGTTLKMKERSELEIPAPGKGGIFQRVRLLGGGVFSKVDTRKSGRFEMETGSAVAAVRGTEFFTAYGRKAKKGRDLWLCVNEGKVEVTSKGVKSSVLVKKGEGIIVKPAAKIAPPKAFAWTKDLNWNMDPDKGEVKDDSSLDSAYKDDLLDHDYD